MAEQSSVMVSFRALVMMVCLVGITLAALFRGSLPEVLKAVKEGRWPSLGGAAHASAPREGGLSEPAKFEPAEQPLPTGPAVAPSQQANSPLPTMAMASATPADPPQLAPRWPAEGPSQRPSAVVPAGYEAAVAPAPRPGAAAGQPPLPPVGAEGPPSANPTTAGAPPNLLPIERPAEKASDPFNQIQDRLRKLGATYYLLESWGGQQQLYRFYCKMAVGGNSNYTRYFEAVESDPLRAMSRVLEQVESWRAGKL